MSGRRLRDGRGHLAGRAPGSGPFRGLGMMARGILGGVAPDGYLLQAELMRGARTDRTGGRVYSRGMGRHRFVAAATAAAIGCIIETNDDGCVAGRSELSVEVCAVALCESRPTDLLSRTRNWFEAERQNGRKTQSIDETWSELIASVSPHKVV